MQLHDLTASEQAALLATREISARELTQAVLDRIAAVEPQVGAYNAITADAALAMIDAGATRLGLSGTRAVLDGLDGLDEAADAGPGTAGTAAGETIGAGHNDVGDY